MMETRIYVRSRCIWMQKKKGKLFQYKHCLFIIIKSREYSTRAYYLILKEMETTLLVWE